MLAQVVGTTAIDFETSGLDPFEPGAYVRAASLATKDICLAIDLQSLGPVELNFFWTWVKNYPGFIMHNASFDKLWATVHGQGLTMDACTSAFFRYMSTDGWAGQSWSLKTAMTDVLGWDEPNTAELYAWLKANKLGKFEMAKAPWEILGPYCALDSSATIQLHEILQKAVSDLPSEVAGNIKDYLEKEVKTEINLLIEQQIKGVCINTKKLDLYSTELNQQIKALEQQFMSQPKVAAAILDLRIANIKELQDVVIEQFTKTGTVAKRWEAHQAKIKAMETLPSEELFNIDSPKQLAWLMYEKLKYKVGRTTEKGEPSVDSKSLPYFDEYGQILIKYRKLRDRLKFVTAANNVQINGVYHPTFKLAGTVSGRLAGGN